MSNPYLYLLKVSWKYARKERRQYVIVYSLFILSSLCIAMNPLLFGWAVDIFQNNPENILSTAVIYAGGYFALNLIVGAMHGRARVMERELGFTLSQNFLNEIFHQLLHLPVNWHKDHHSGSTIDRLKKAYNALKRFFSNGFFYFYTFSQFLLSLFGMVYFSPVFGTVALGLGFVTIWVILKFDKPYIKSMVEINEKEHHMSATLTDSLVNIFTVITLKLESRMKVDLLGKFENMLSPFRRNVKINEWKWFTANILIHIIYVVMVLGYVFSNYESGKTFYLGGLVALLGFVNQFTAAFSRINQAYTDIITLNTDVRTVDIIEQAYHERPSNEIQVPVSADWRYIELKNLSFYYGEKERKRQTDTGGVSALAVEEYTVLPPKKKKIKGVENVRLHLKKGQRVALIGESGCGKSTLLTLLRGLHTPLPGVELIIDGKPVQGWRNFSDMVTLFPQEPEIFENTILYNITLGLPFSEQEVMEVCDLVCFTEVIKQLPHGLESNIQEKGVNLSVGQKQRLALARGVLACRNSSIILLDEPTSSVDSQTEIIIYKRIFEAFGDKTIVSSLHNLHLVSLFDYGYVINDGRIIEEGITEDLVKGDYLRLTQIAISS